MAGNQINTTRPAYMNRLKRKQCNAILKTRARMLPVKANQRNNHTNITCRLCQPSEETQQHILEECTRLQDSIIYKEAFENNNIENISEIANSIILIIEEIENRNPSQK